MPKPKRTGLIIALVAAGLAVLCVVLGGGAFLFLRTRLPDLVAEANASASAGASAPAGVAPSATTTPPKAFEGDIRTLLLAKPPSAKKLLLVDRADDGTITASNQASRYGDKAYGLRRLDNLGYQQGCWIAWEESTAKVHVFLHQFGDSAKAYAWVADTQFGFVNSDFEAGQSITGVALGRYFVAKKVDENGYWYLRGQFSKNDIAADVTVLTSGKPDPARLIKLAQDQFAKLP